MTGALFSFVDPTPAPPAPPAVAGHPAYPAIPTVLAASPDVGALVGLAADQLTRPEFAAVFGGATIPPSAHPYAQNYGGHQFGSWAGQLGDGRAITLGDVASPVDSGSRFELQLKGAGRTPYSRFADGRAVLRSSLREYVASEAMAAVAIPTTRALSLVLTGGAVERDQFYDGRPSLEPGAVVTRVSRCFVRFGSFELPASRGDKELVKQLADFVIQHHYSPSVPAGDYAAFLNAILQRTAKTVARWQGVGFVHGVLNTDNLSVAGSEDGCETIDYGPYGWLEAVDPDFTPNTTDIPGRRYSFRGQPMAAAWNGERLATAFLAGGLVSEAEATAAVEEYVKAISSNYEAVSASKFGLPAYDRDRAVAWLRLLVDAQADWTNAWRSLSSVVGAAAAAGAPPPADLVAALSRSPPVPAGSDRCAPASWDDVPCAIKTAASEWLESYRTALSAAGVADAPSRAAAQDAVNPAVVPRNHLLQAAIDATSAGDGGAELGALLAAVGDPFTGGRPESDRFRVPAPLTPRRGVELLSCSS